MGIQWSLVDSNNNNNDDDNDSDNKNNNNKDNNKGREVIDQLWYPIYWKNSDDFIQRSQCCINQPIAIPNRLAFLTKEVPILKRLLQSKQIGCLPGVC